MRKLAALAGIAAVGLSAQSALAYTGTASVTFTFGGSASAANADQGWVTSAGPVAMSSFSNNTYFSQLSGAGNTINSINTYNQDFASQSQCASLVSGFSGSVQKYGCKYGSTGFVAIPVTDSGPVGQASGSLTVTDTTLTGVLNLVSTTDEPTGATTTTIFGTNISASVGDGTNGYNYRSADGSPFGNSWYGTTTAGTLTVNLTGTFTASSWTIDGGYVDYSDSGFACQQGGFGGDARGTLCIPSGAGGGFANDGGNLSWGMDLDGGLTTGTNNPTPSQITLRGASGTDVLATLSGVLANLTLDGSGNITGGTGEFRRGLGSTFAGCGSFLRYNTGTSSLTCGNLTAGNLAITGVVTPVPAAAWLLGSALGLLGWIRRRASA